ncbi:polysaccharide deacetylase [Streptomyces chartreusis]|uniref:polysaccharide deacetylase family protein n=1 Tax=Streptomyces chartreusis TaxID=1969 RepID=UPI0036786F25
MSWLQGSASLAALTFDLDAESPILAVDQKHAGNASAMSHQAYGPQVGVGRILALLADYSLPATFFVPGLSAELHPKAVEAILEAGHEVAHHTYAHRPAVRQSEAEEREDFERALEALGRFGVSPQGHRAAGWEASWRTPSLVAEYGLTYDSSLMDDDRPYRLRTPAGTIAELPVHWSLDDWEQYAFLPDPSIGHVIEDPAKVRSMWTGEVDAMARHGCLFILTCHPFLSGRPSRIEALRGVIEHALGRGDVEFVSAGEVARRAHADSGLPERELSPLELVDGRPAAAH